jgi:hypothetical protein
VAIHHPPPQNCYAGSSTSSWPSPVRGVRHGRDARYCALYSAHKGVPVQREVLVMEAPVPQEWLHILNGKSYQIACHMLARYQVELAQIEHHAETASNKATSCVPVQWVTYRSSTIHTSCRNTFHDQQKVSRIVRHVAGTGDVP